MYIVIDTDNNYMSLRRLTDFWSFPSPYFTLSNPCTGPTRAWAVLS